MKIGIVGLGFVGGAVKNAYDLAGIEVVCVDPIKGYTATFDDLQSCDGVFVCVPSPTRDDGACDTSILESVVEKLANYKGVIISKVTAPPNVYIELNKKYPNLVHAPEFLTAANANADYLNGEFLIIGGNYPYRVSAYEIIVEGQKNIRDYKIRLVGIGEASLIKYTINSFLSVKVSFMNELYNLVQAAGLNWNDIRESLPLDPRQGTSHFDVPGPDGKFGFGGACFPKDTSALLKYAEEVYRGEEDLQVLQAAVDVNKIVRN